MEYVEAAGYAGGALGQKAAIAKRVRPLDGIEENADRLERLACMIEQFADRFYRGAMPMGESACTPVPSGYSGQIERLTGITERLDKAIQNLTEIG